MTADEVKKLLGLVPHPCEGGWFRQTYESDERVAAEAFADVRYAGARLTGTAIYYLLESDSFSEMHRLRSDEVFHFYAGDAVEMLQLDQQAGGRSGRRRKAAGGGATRRVARIAAGGGRPVGAAWVYRQPRLRVRGLRGGQSFGAECRVAPVRRADPRADAVVLSKF